MDSESGAGASLSVCIDGVARGSGGLVAELCWFCVGGSGGLDGKNKGGEVLRLYFL